MAEIKRGQAGPFYVTAKGIDLTPFTIELTIKARGKEITKTGSDLSVSYAESVTAIAYWLTQEETLSLPQGPAEAQIRYIGADAIASGAAIVLGANGNCVQTNLIELIRGI